MRGGALPPALLLAALALLLATVPRAVAVRAIVVAAVASLLAWAVFMRWLPSTELAFFGLWASVVLTALGVYLRRLPGPLAIAAGANAGVWSGATVAVAGHAVDLGIALACLGIIHPARLVVARGWGIAVKVVASWLLAVAILAALLPTVPTPGYMPDHMD